MHFLRKLFRNIRAILQDPDRKNIFKILWEFLYCSYKKRCIAVHYFTCFLYRKDVKNVLDYLTEKEAKWAQDVINHPSLSDVASSKLSFIEHFSRGGFMVPRLLGYNLVSKLYINNNGSWEAIDIESSQCLHDHLEKIMDLWNIDEIFIKLIRGSGGIGAQKIQRRILNDKSQIERLFISLNKNSYVLQEVVQQHPELSKFNPYTLNTVRIDTFRVPGGKPKILSAVFRIGGSGQCVDNTSSGGIFIGVNVDTGRLKQFGYNFFHVSDEVRYFRKSPITGVEFEGFLLPHFEELKNAVTSAAAYMPPALTGWDVAISPSGPVFIEANILYYGILGLNTAYGGYLKNTVWQEVVTYAKRLEKI